jgi:hypothetical protein
VIASSGGTHEDLIAEIHAIGHVAEFQAKFDQLFSEIVTKMLGKTEDVGLCEEILAL